MDALLAGLTILDCEANFLEFPSYLNFQEVMGLIERPGPTCLLGRPPRRGGLEIIRGWGWPTPLGAGVPRHLFHFFLSIFSTFHVIRYVIFQVQSQAIDIQYVQVFHLNTNSFMSMIHTCLIYRRIDEAVLV